MGVLLQESYDKLEENLHDGYFVVFTSALGCLMRRFYPIMIYRIIGGVGIVVSHRSPFISEVSVAQYRWAFGIAISIRLQLWFLSAYQLSPLVWAERDYVDWLNKYLLLKSGEGMLGWNIAQILFFIIIFYSEAPLVNCTW